MSKQQYHFWNNAFGGPEYFYGFEPGPVARRAVRYHRPLWQSTLASQIPTALDVGCGEGQDLVFLAEAGYAATGLEWTQSGADKSRQLLSKRGQEAEIIVSDLREYSGSRTFDLVLAVNALQFLGEDAVGGLEKVISAVAVGGVLGMSVFACDEGEASVCNGICFFSMDELLAKFEWSGRNRRWQMLETAQLQQWNRSTNQPQQFLTLVAQRLK